jgi:hypothetical protein
MRTLRILGVTAALAAAVLAGCGGEPGADTATAGPAAAEGAGSEPATTAGVEASPEAFVRALYVDDAGAAQAQADARRIYSARTAALFAENDRLYAGYVGYPDADPICDCQDGEGVAVTRASTTVVDASRARVEVALTNGQAHTFVLVREADGWRIDDVEGLSGGPLVAGLQASNAEAAPRAAPPA